MHALSLAWPYCLALVLVAGTAFSVRADNATTAADACNPSDSGNVSSVISDSQEDAFAGRFCSAADSYGQICQENYARPIGLNDMNQIKAKPSVRNIGFMTSAAAELRNKFPMCEEFLDVEWIDKEKGLGATRYALYDQFGGIIQPTVDALVYFGSNDYAPQFDILLNKFYSIEDKGGVSRIKNCTRQDCIELLRDSRFERYRGWGLRVKKDNKTLEFPTWPEFRERVFKTKPYTLSAYSSRVCIPYPDGKRMWIAETKNIDKSLPPSCVKAFVGEIESAIIQPDARCVFMADSADEYVIPSARRSIYFLCDGFAFCHNGKIRFVGFNYEKMNKPTAEKNVSYDHYTFFKGKDCTTRRAISMPFFTTDGENLYYNNQCNLNKLAFGDE